MLHPVLLFALSTIVKLMLKSLTRSGKNPELKDRLGKVDDEIGAIRSKAKAARKARKNDHPYDPRYNNGKTFTLVFFCFLLAGCTLRPWNWLRLVDSGTSLPTPTTTTTIPTTPNPTIPPKPVTVDYRGNYQAWPLSVDKTNLTTVPAFQFTAWGTSDQPLPAGVGAKYPASFFWKLEEKVYGEITTTNGEQGGGFFFVRVDASTLRKAELTIASDKKLYTYAPANPAQSQYPIQPTIQ